MLDLLRRYFFHFHALSLPGIGTLQAKSVTAVLDFPERKLFPPTYETILIPFDASKMSLQVEWLAEMQNIDPQQVRNDLDAFAADIQKAILSDTSFLLEDICSLQKNASGKIQCKSLLNTGAFFKPQHAEKVIRQQEAHMVRVGETERTSTEMEAMLSEASPERKDYWWVAAILLLFIAVGAWYSFKTMHPAQSDHHSFFHPIQPKEAPSTYRELP